MINTNVFFDFTDFQVRGGLLGRRRRHVGGVGTIVVGTVGEGHTGGGRVPPLVVQPERDGKRYVCPLLFLAC